MRRTIAILVLAVALAGCGSSGGGLPAAMTASSFKAWVGHFVEHRAHVYFASSSCVDPSAWQPGRHFTCYFYRSGGAEIGRVIGIVLPSHGRELAANFSWHPGG